jgi:hypothetical protein
MITSQGYLDNKYPTSKEKKQVKEINIHQISQERKEQNVVEKLDGGELDLSEYINLEIL